MNRLLKYFLVAIFLAVIGMVVAYFLAKKFEPEVKDAVVYEINRHLAVPVQVEDINLSLLQRFPYASLRFSNVVIPEVGKADPDTLIFIEDLYLQIGLSDFLKKNYAVSEAEINRGFFRMKVLEGGRDNYRFWKNSGDSLDTDVSLTDIELRDFDYVLSTSDGLDLSVSIDRGEAFGNFGEKVFSLNTNIELIAEMVKYEGEDLYRGIPMEGKVGLLIDGNSREYSFSSGSIMLGNENFSLDGKYSNSEDVPFWKIALTSRSTDLEKAAQLVPLPNGKIFETYIPNGKANFNLLIYTRNGFDLELGFDGLSGQFKHSESSGSAEVYSGKGNYRLKKGISGLSIEGLEAAIGPGRFTTKGELIDFESPRFDLSVIGRMQLEELKDFFNIQFAKVLEGDLDIKGRLTGSVKGPEIDTERLLKGVNFHGQILLKGGAFQTIGRAELFEDIEGAFEIIDNAISAQDLQARVGDNQFSIEGNIFNALPFLVGKGEKLQIKADLISEHIDLAAFVNEGENPGEGAALKLPEDIGFNLGISIDHLTYKRFEAFEVSGNAIYHNGLFTINPMEMKMASGQFKGGFRLRESGAGFAVASDGVLYGMNVNEFFKIFDDFGQEVITHEQVNGKMAAEVNLTCSLDSLLHIDKKSVKADVDLRIEKGKLKQVRSLLDIADYIDKNPIWDAFIKTEILKDKLHEVEFATLENQLSISNERITIPEMTLSTSVLDLTASGTHDFDNEMDYSVNFRLSELLQTGREKESEFGYVVDDGTGMKIFLRMYGSVDDPQFETDKERAREKRKEKFDEEKQTFKGILQEEFGLFKSDTTLSAPADEEKGEEIMFDVEWGGELETDSLKSKIKGKKRSSHKDLYQESDEDDDL